MSPWQDGELALAEFCLKRPRGVVEVGETFSYSEDEDFYRNDNDRFDDGNVHDIVVKVGETFSYSEDNGLNDTVMTVLISWWDQGYNKEFLMIIFHGPEAVSSVRLLVLR